jgi:hypothetical protein
MVYKIDQIRGKEGKRNRTVPQENESHGEAKKPHEGREGIGPAK